MKRERERWINGRQDTSTHTHSTYIHTTSDRYAYLLFGIGNIVRHVVLLFVHIFMHDRNYIQTSMEEEDCLVEDFVSKNIAPTVRSHKEIPLPMT